MKEYTGISKQWNHGFRLPEATLHCIAQKHQTLGSCSSVIVPPSTIEAATIEPGREKAGFETQVALGPCDTKYDLGEFTMLLEATW
jgi:hypothetical protein